MVRKELIRRSPLRVLENSLKKPLEKGEIAVVASPKGIGKTGCLVHMATDSLLQDKQVIHVSFSTRTDHIISWYEDIFKEVARTLNSAMDVHDEIVRHRVIMSFNQSGVKTQQILRSLQAMIQDGHFAADLVIVDGYNFYVATPEDIRLFKEFAREVGVMIWFSATVKPENEPIWDRNFPPSLRPFEDLIDVLITLGESEGNILIRLVKDRDSYPGTDLSVQLDPRTLMIVEEKK
ncbi:MAG: AAA family ATPase [Spirochaetales bacterium]